jgi:hypothetical protein
LKSVLRDLVERFLDNVKNERNFDSTLLTLLSAEGYYDVHFTHGLLEFGKDFVAKRVEDGVTYQYALQSKAGDIGAGDWRQVRQQMFETLTNSIGGPAFDTSLPLRTRLVLTGRLVGTAGADHAEFVRSMAGTFPKATVLQPWDRQDLLDLLLKHGPEKLFRSGIDIRSYGAFYRLYGDIVERLVKVDDIEKHFEVRLHADVPPEDRVAAVGLEARLFADAARTSDQPYLALQALLAALRSVAYEIQRAGSMNAMLGNLLRAATADVLEQARTVSETYIKRAEAAGCLSDAAGGAGLYVVYPVLCSHVMDGLVLQCVLGEEKEARDCASALAELIATEPGCAHPISDRYAVSIAWAARTLRTYGHMRGARALVKESALWLVDRYWDGGAGLAPCDASEREEIVQLLGDPFSGLNVIRDGGSLLACVLLDAACLLQDREVYDGLRKDMLAADIVPRYYQVADTEGQFEYAAADIVRYPNVEFAETMPSFESLAHGNHLKGEPLPRLADVLGEGVYVAASLLMRDRWFPRLWAQQLPSAETA